jgi:hypothetical protein
MTTVKIVIQEGALPGFGPSTTVVVRRSTTAAALAAALGAVLPQIPLRWAELMSAARVMRLAAKRPDDAVQGPGECEGPVQVGRAPGTLWLLAELSRTLRPSAPLPDDPERSGGS